MEMPKASDQDKAYFRSLFEDRPDIDLRPMFGQLAAFVATNSQMCAGLFGAAVGLRLPEDERAALFGEPGAAPFGPPDRPMKEYAALPVAWRGDPERTDEWIDRAIVHTSSLPAKKKTKKNKP